MDFALDLELTHAILEVKLEALLTGNKLDKTVLISHVLEHPILKLSMEENAIFSEVKMMKTINLMIYGNLI